MEEGEEAVMEEGEQAVMGEGEEEMIMTKKVRMKKARKRPNFL